MGLDNDLYTCLFADWDGTIITKPLFHKNEQDVRPEPRHVFLHAKEKGQFNEDSSDNTMDEKNQPFTITIYEANEAEVILSIRATKKALHEKAITSGYYHIDDFEITERNQLVTAVLQGRSIKMISESEF